MDKTFYLSRTSSGSAYACVGEEDCNLILKYLTIIIIITVQDFVDAQFNLNN